MQFNFKTLRYILLPSVILSVNSCTKTPTDYRSFINGQEKVYPGLVSNINILPGDNRLLMTWIPNSDANVSQYIVYWNNGSDSIMVDATSNSSSDTVKTYVNNIEEATHNLEVYSLYATGERSTPLNVGNVKVYGDFYRGSLLNRPVSGISYVDNTVTITWNVPDTINITTEVQYTNVLNEIKTLYLQPDISTLVLPDWKLPTRIFYRSSYKPQANAIDTFKVNGFDSLGVPNLPVDKSSWSPAPLPLDAVQADANTVLSNIWNGQPGSYPDIYQTDGDAIPHTFTIDLGKTYNQLTKFEEWGRSDINSLNNGNPIGLEVWGIEDTTGASTLLLPADQGWKEESISKGWTLLTEVNRNDDGVAGVQANIISNPPPVRFIRLRVLSAVTNTTSSYMSEISFWFNP